MLSSLALMVLCQPGPDPAPLDAAQFARVVRGQLAPLHDMEFIYEGESRRLDGTVDGSGSRFQGTYAFRMSDGAAHLDVYRHPGGNERYTHSTLALFNFELERIDRTPDLKEPIARPIRTPGGASSLNISGSPTFYVFYWYLRWLDDPERRGYEFQGWEEIEGHRCLRVQFDEVPEVKGRDRPVERLWLDMERGGLPLKIELWRHSKLRLRTHHVKLGRVPLPGGKEIWFPIHGETDNGDDATSKTINRETCDLIKGSLRLNQGLPDSRFAITWKRDGAEPSILRRARQSFENAKPSQPVHLLRTDPAGVQQHLDEQLAEADRQSRQLEASSVARESWGWTSILQVICLLVGIALLGVVLVRKWRSR